jgi:hypothetical protein
MVSLRGVQPLTGYIRPRSFRSGVQKGYPGTGLLMKVAHYRYPVYIDELAEICDVISVTAGIRALQILLTPNDYIRAVKATVAAIARLSGKVLGGRGRTLVWQERRTLAGPSKNVRDSQVWLR